MISKGKIARKSVKGQTFLKIPVVTDDFQMRELGITFGIEVWGLLDLLKIMYRSKWIELSEIKSLLKDL
jgi:predicted nucleic acid-binding protein